MQKNTQSEFYQNVFDFHKKYRFTTTNNLETDYDSMSTDGKLHLFYVIRLLKDALYYSADAEYNEIFMRLSLIIEELIELCQAMDNRDIISMADALGDLSYVINGTAVSYNLPLSCIEKEIHKSNMTKKQSASNVHNKSKKLIDKGNSYVPPNLVDIIKDHNRKGHCEYCK